MLENIENLNKQIASFILCTASIVIPAGVSHAEISGNLIADASMNFGTPVEVRQVISMYAAPQVPIDIVKPVPIPVQPIISMYAAPQIPIEVTPVPTPIPGPPPNISMYAAPEVPMRPINPKHIFPTIEPMPERIPLPKAEPSMNESSLNINNINSPKAMGNLEKANNINANTNINKNISTLNSAMRTDNFVTTEFGNIRVIEPYAHFVFK